MIDFKFLDPKMTYEHLGFIPQFLSNADPRPAKEQLHENYIHGGGWRPFEGFKMLKDKSIKYSGDPAHKPLAEATLRDEIIVYYDYSWVAIIQKDGSFEISRMD